MSVLLMTKRTVNITLYTVNVFNVHLQGTFSKVHNPEDTENTHTRVKRLIKLLQ